MSLKAFHVVFMSVCLLLSLGLAGWSMVRYASEPSAFDLVFGAGWLLGAVVLVVYGRYFFRKLRNIEYL